MKILNYDNRKNYLNFLFLSSSHVCNHQRSATSFDFFNVELKEFGGHKQFNNLQLLTEIAVRSQTTVGP